MYACMHVCMYACMYVCTYVCIYVCMHGCMYVCMHACMYVCMHASMYICIHLLLYIPTYIYIYVIHLVVHIPSISIYLKRNNAPISLRRTEVATAIPATASLCPGAHHHSQMEWCMVYSYICIPLCKWVSTTNLCNPLVCGIYHSSIYIYICIYYRGYHGLGCNPK